MHRCLTERSIRLLLPLAIAFVAHRPLQAQFLDLDPLPPKPELATGSVVESQAERLRSEIELLRDHDDRLVIIVAGDAVRFEFEAPQVQSGMTRTWFLKITGWAKEGSFLNFTGQHLRRTDVIYNVSYSEDLDHVQKVLEDLIAADERFLTTPEPIVRVKQFSDSSIDFLVRAYVKTEEFWETLWALNKAVKQRFDAEGITIPFPQRDVHLPTGPGDAS